MDESLAWMIAASENISQKKRECKNDVGVYYRYKLEWANLCVCVFPSIHLHLRTKLGSSLATESSCRSMMFQGTKGITLLQPSLRGQSERQQGFFTRPPAQGFFTTAARRTTAGFPTPCSRPGNGSFRGSAAWTWSWRRDEGPRALTKLLLAARN